jgi:sugar phosphate isomerase/epimerase
LRQDLATCQKLSAPACRIWPGTTDSEDTDADLWMRVAADLKQACRLANDAGIAITLERHGGTVTNSLWGCRRIIDEVDDENMWINYQIGTRIDEEIIAEEIRSLAPYILNVHATNHTHADGKRVWKRLEDGDVNWAALIDELAANGVDDAIVEVEFARRGVEEISNQETEAEVAADIAFLKRCMQD